MSKNWTIILSGILLLFPVTINAKAVSTCEEEPALIYFYRMPNYYGSGIRMKISVDDIPVVMLKNASWFQYAVEPGEYFISCRAGSESRIKMRVEPGGVYYVKAYLNPGFWSTSPVLEVVDAISGKSVIDGGSLRPMEYKALSQERSRERAGLFFGGGFGFESVALFYDEDNNDVTLSTGGGFAVGAEYGMEINRNFDLSVSLFYQGSSLIPYLKNASASFNRMIITATPALIIPVKGGEFHRFRLGVGPGIYTFGGMKIDASKLGASKFEYKYNTALGIHGSFVYESKFAERGSYTMGLKYYDVKYEYNPQRSTHSVTEPLISSPAGRGIDFIFGYYYRF